MIGLGLSLWRRGAGGGEVTTGTLLVDFTQQSATVDDPTTYGAVGRTVTNDGAFGDYTVTRKTQTHETTQLGTVTTTANSDGWLSEHTTQTTPSAERAIRYKLEFSQDMDLSSNSNLVIEWGVPPYTDTSQGLYIGLRPMFMNSAESNQWWSSSPAFIYQAIPKSRKMITVLPMSQFVVSSGSVNWANVRKIVLYIKVIYTRGGNYVNIRKMWLDRKNAKAKFSFTFDDGHHSVYKYAYPALSTNSIRAGLAVIKSVAETGTDATNGWMSPATIQTLYGAGWATYNHMVTSARTLCTSLTINAAATSGATLTCTTTKDWVFDNITAGNSYTIRNSFGPEFNTSMVLASKSGASSPWTLVFTVPGGVENAIDTYGQTQPSHQIDHPTESRATTIANEVTPCTTYLQSLGCTKGSNFFVIPEGSYEPSWQSSLEGAGFIGARGTGTYFRLNNSPTFAVTGTQYDSGWFDQWDIRNIALDGVANTAPNRTLFEGYVDAAIADGSYISFYGHVPVDQDTPSSDVEYPAVSSSLKISTPLLTHLAGYIKTKVDAGTAEIVTLDEMATRYG